MKFDRFTNHLIGGNLGLIFFQNYSVFSLHIILRLYGFAAA